MRRVLRLMKPHSRLHMIAVRAMHGVAGMEAGVTFAKSLQVGLTSMMPMLAAEPASGQCSSPPSVAVSLCSRARSLGTVPVPVTHKRMFRWRRSRHSRSCSTSVVLMIVAANARKHGTCKTSPHQVVAGGEDVGLRVLRHVGQRVAHPDGVHVGDEDGEAHLGEQVHQVDLLPTLRGIGYVGEIQQWQAEGIALEAPTS